MPPPLPAVVLPLTSQLVSVRLSLVSRMPAPLPEDRFPPEIERLFRLMATDVLVVLVSEKLNIRRVVDAAPLL